MKLNIPKEAGVYGFVNFGLRLWWYCGHFCEKAGKIWKKNISKRNNFEKKGKKMGWFKNTK